MKDSYLHLSRRSISLAPPPDTQFQCSEVIARDALEQSSDGEAIINEAMAEVTNLLAQAIVKDMITIDHSDASVTVSADVVVLPTWKYRDQVASAYDHGCIAGGAALRWNSAEELAADKAEDAARHIAAMLLAQHMSEPVQEFLLGELHRMAKDQAQQVKALKAEAANTVMELLRQFEQQGMDFMDILAEASSDIELVRAFTNKVCAVGKAITTGDMDKVREALALSDVEEVQA